MAENSKIEWTDHTFNPWIGCTKVSPGCAHCYAERDFDHRKGRVKWGAGNARARTSADNWKLPPRWNRYAPLFLQCGQGCRFQGNQGALDGFCPKCGHPEANYTRPRVFCSSLADWLDDEVPIEWFHDLIDVVFSTPNLDWQLLTKRPQNWRRRIDAVACRGSLLAQQWIDGHAPANVWLGTSVEDQTRANERVPELLKVPARVRFLSCEPLLGLVDLTRIDATSDTDPGYSALELKDGDEGDLTATIDWVIVGGESGPLARAMHPVWVRSLRDQCEQAGVAFFFKQWGEWLPQHQEMNRTTNAPAAAFQIFPDGLRTFRVGKIRAGRLLDGVQHSQFANEEASA